MDFSAAGTLVDSAYAQDQFATVLGSSERAGLLIRAIHELNYKHHVNAPKLMTIAHHLLVVGCPAGSIPSVLEKMISEFDLAGSRLS